MNQTKGFIALVSTAGILGTFGVLIRILSESFSDVGQVFVRSVFATLIIAFIVAYKKIHPLKLFGSDRKYIFLFSTAFPLSLLLFTYSANSIKVSNSLFMLYVGSLISTALFGRFVFQEKFTSKHIASLILALAGLTFFVHPFSPESFSLGIIAGILSGIFEGASHTLRKLMKGVKREVVVFYQSLSGVVFAFGLLLFSNEVLFKEFHIVPLLVAMLFGLLLVVIGYLLVYGFSNFDVNLGTIILATELLFALVINALILKEYPTSYEIIGGLLVFSATVLVSMNLKSRKKAQTQPTLKGSTESGG